MADTNTIIGNDLKSIVYANSVSRRTFMSGFATVAAAGVLFALTGCNGSSPAASSAAEAE